MTASVASRGWVTALLAGAMLVVGAPRAHAEITGAPLVPAKPRVVRLAAVRPTTPIPLDANPGAWHGRLSHLAGTAHYDRGEWIYEDYPFSAYGAALPAETQLLQSLGLIGAAVPQTQRIPGGLSEVNGPAGAGPFVDEADLSELRLAVRGRDLYVLARTTTMRTPVRTALLLLFDTGRGGGASRTVPFGSGLTTTRADTAALVTAAGTRIVDLVTGRTTGAPAAADPAGYVNALETRLPVASVAAPGGSQVRLVAATGLVAPGSYDLLANGQAGPLAKVVPRFGVPVQAVYDRLQAEALAGHDIDGFITTVSLDRLRRGDRERLLPGIGYSVRTFDAPASISGEGGMDGTLRDYGLYVPRGFSGRPAPATLLLRGSGMTAHSLAAITPGIFQQLGDDNGAIVISPGGRSGFDMWENAAYRDALQAVGDAERLLPIDRNRLTVAGYSMGGFGTYLFAATQPDRFAGAFVVEGPVGGIQPASANSIVYAFPDVVPSLVNLVYTPIEIFQGTDDADVPASNALAAVQELRAAGLRYKLNLLPGNDHFTPGILNDYTIGARYLRGARRTTAPSEVRLTRIMPFEHAVDTGVDSDQPHAGHSVGLRFDHAWFVHGLDAAEPVNGTASIDVTTLARPPGTVQPVQAAGADPAVVGGEPPSPFDEQRWVVGRSRARPRNALSAQLTGASHAALDLAAMGLTAARALTAQVRTDSRLTLALELRRPACVTVSADRGAWSRPRRVRSVTVALAPGDHRVALRPCRARRRAR